MTHSLHKQTYSNIAMFFNFQLLAFMYECGTKIPKKKRRKKNILCFCTFIENECTSVMFIKSDIQKSLKDIYDNHQAVGIYFNLKDYNRNGKIEAFFLNYL